MVKKLIFLSLVLNFCFANQYTIDEIIDLAYKNDMKLQSIKLEYEAKTQVKDQMRSYLLPSIDLTGKLNSYKNDTQYDNGRQSEDTYTQRYANIRLTQVVYNKEKMLNYTTTDNEIDSFKLKYLIAQEDLLLDVIEKYVNILNANESLKLIQSEKNSVNEQRLSAKKRYDLGEGTVIDLYNTQSRFDIIESDEINALNNLQTAKDELSLITNNSIDNISSKVKEEFTKVYLDNVENLLAKSKKNNKQILLNNQNKQIAKDNYAKLVSRDKPTLDLVVDYFKDDYIGYKLDSKNYVEEEYYIGLLFKMNLYNGGLSEYQQKEKKLLIDKAVKDLEYTKREIKHNTYKEFLSFNNLLRSAKSIKKAIVSTKMALKATEVGFRLGNRTSLDVLNVKHQLYSAKKSLLETKYKLILTYFRLKNSLGELNRNEISIFFK